MVFKASILAIFIVISGMVIQAQPDTVKAKMPRPGADTAAVKPLPPKQVRPAPMLMDTSAEHRNWERYYYGAGEDDLYDTNPWDEFLFQDADNRAGGEERDDRAGQEASDRSTQGQDNRE